MNIKIFPLVVISVVMLSACNKSGGEHDHPELTTGKQLYDLHCAECHKEDAQGKVFYGFPNLVKLKLDVNEIREQVLGKEGPGRKMPLFTSMPDDEVMLIAEYLVQMK